MKAWVRQNSKLNCFPPVTITADAEGSRAVRMGCDFWERLLWKLEHSLAAAAAICFIHPIVLTLAGEWSFVPPPPSSSGRGGAHGDRNLMDIAKLSQNLGLQPIQIMVVNPHFHKTGRRDERGLSAIHGLKLEPAEPRIVQTLSQLRS